MLIEVKLKGEKVFPSQIKGGYAYEKNVILIVRSSQGRALFVDYATTSLGSYSPPPFLQGKVFYYEIVRVPEEYSNYLDCIAKAVEEKLHPVIKNKRLECRKQVTVMISEAV